MSSFREINNMAKKFGSQLRNCFMSHISLLVERICVETLILQYEPQVGEGGSLIIGEKKLTWLINMHFGMDNPKKISKY